MAHIGEESAEGSITTEGSGVDDAEVFEVANMFANWFLSKNKTKRIRAEGETEDTSHTADSSKPSDTDTDHSVFQSHSEGDTSNNNMKVKSLLDSIIIVENGGDTYSSASKVVKKQEQNRRKKQSKKKKKKQSRTDDGKFTDLFNLNDGKDHLFTPVSSPKSHKKRKSGISSSSISGSSSKKEKISTKVDSFDFNDLLCCVNDLEKESLNDLCGKLKQSKCIVNNDRNMLHKIVMDYLKLRNGLVSTIRQAKRNKQKRQRKSKLRGKRQRYDSRVERKLQMKQKRIKARRKAKW